MRFALDRARKLISVGGLVRCARSFYELIGNRRKAVRQPTSGNIFATFHGIVANSTYACLCVDVSLKGIGVECHEPMRPPSERLMRDPLNSASNRSLGVAL